MEAVHRKARSTPHSGAKKETKKVLQEKVMRIGFGSRSRRNKRSVLSKARIVERRVKRDPMRYVRTGADSPIRGRHPRTRANGRPPDVLLPKVTTSAGPVIGPISFWQRKPRRRKQCRPLHRERETCRPLSPFESEKGYHPVI